MLCCVIGGHLEQLLALKPLMERLYDSFILTEKTAYDAATCAGSLCAPGESTRGKLSSSNGVQCRDVSSLLVH